MKNFILKWYSVIIAFFCMLYSIGLGLMGNTDEAIYSAHWPGTILLFTLVINQIRNHELCNIWSRISFIFNLHNFSNMEFN